MQTLTAYDITFAAVLVGLSALSSWSLTGVTRQHAIRKAMLDLPNERSSHSAPTPRGGGAAIAITVLVFTALLGLTDLFPRRIAIGLFIGGALVAAVGWLDDRREVSPLLRAGVHACAALCTVLAVGGMPTVAWGTDVIHTGLLGSLAAALAIVWATNSYNFMDGIDGLAATEAVVAGIGGTAFLAMGGNYALAALSLAIAGSASGFLVWNWMPARIFMGDVGSGFLGFMFGSLAVMSERSGAAPWYAWLMLLLVFAMDSTVTLLRRIAHGEKWYAAHRLHAYQRLVQSGYNHARVVASVAILNVLLALLALAAVRRPALAPLILTLSVVLVLTLYGLVERRNGMWSASSAAGRT